VNKFTIGRTLIFANGEKRKIVNRGLEHRIFIAFDGSPLDGDKVGFPNIIEVVN
jgi:hypothetical protein